MLLAFEFLGKKTSGELTRVARKDTPTQIQMVVDVPILSATIPNTQGETAEPKFITVVFRP